MSPCAEKVLGYPLAQWLEQPDFWTDHLHPEDRERAVRLCRDATDRGEDHDLDCRMIAANGRVVWLRDLVRIVRGPAGEVRGLRGLMVDVTVQRQAEEVMRQRESRLQILKAISSGLTAGMRAEEIIARAVRALADQFPEVRVGYSTIDADGRLRVMQSDGPGGMPDITGLTADLNRATDYLRALRDRQSVIVPDVSLDPRLDALSREMSAGGTRAVLDVPLQHSDRLMGLLCFDAPAPRPWSPHEIATLTEVAEYLSVVLRDARLQEERRRAEEELRRSEERLRALFERAPVGIAISRDFRVVYANAVAARILGYDDARDLHGVCILDHMAPEDRARVEAHGGRRERRDEVSSSCDRVIKRLDGSRVPVHVELARVLLPDGPATVVFVADIASQRAAEEALRRSEERFRSLVESAPVGISISRGLTRLYANPALARMFGYDDPRELSRRSVLELVAPQERAVAEERLRRRERGEAAPTSYDLTGVRKDGTQFPVHLNVATISLPDGTATVRFAVDLTERRRAEEALRANEERLRRAQRMEAVGRIAGGVAHDFNNLLTAVLGYSEMLLADLDPAGPHHHQAGEINRAAERGARLTQQLLAFSRKQVLEPRLVDLTSLVRDVHRMLERVIGEGVRIRMALGEPLGSILADPGQIEQVVMNLAVNARDAMPGGGTLTLETADVTLPAEQPGFSLTAPAGPYVMLAVGDDGVGMEAEVLAHIFEPFFTTKERGKGTGLGLATVYGIVHQSGGAIRVESASGRGTTMRIYLPCSEGAKGLAPAGPPRAGSSRGAETVLLVEDEEIVRSLLRATLAENGYQVLVASGGEDALELARGRDGPIHLVVTDVVMPGMSGRQLAERLAAERAGVRVLFISGYPGDEAWSHGDPPVGAAFLQKPFTPETLIRRVREMLDAPTPA